MAKNAATGELDARLTDKWTAAGTCPQFRITWCGANPPGWRLNWINCMQNIFRGGFSKFGSNLPKKAQLSGLNIVETLTDAVT